MAHDFFCYSNDFLDKLSNKIICAIKTSQPPTESSSSPSASSSKQQSMGGGGKGSRKSEPFPFNRGFLDIFGKLLLCSMTKENCDTKSFNDSILKIEYVAENVIKNTPQILLKIIPMSQIMKVLKFIQKYLSHQFIRNELNVNQKMDCYRLKLLMRYLRCPFLQRRLDALNYLKDLILFLKDRTSNRCDPYYNPGQYCDPPYWFAPLV